MVGEAFADFNNYFRPRRLFFPKHTVKKIEEFRAGLYRISLDFMYYVEQGREFRSPTKDDFDVWQKASDYTSQEAPKLLADLEDDFRTILGIEQT